MVPREIQLAKDPFVNGQALEVFLYKDATECPICFLYYPPYLNKTRCCDQPICSECFVQIKRPEPHPPEHEQNDHTAPAPPTPDATTLVEPPEALVSEPATCPYCQQAEFGVTYDPPPFRRGLSYANPHGLGSFASAMSSSSSLNSTGSPTTLVPQGAKHKRRTTSISANASTVITTDRVRPDWATKLAAARSHLARRSAAATALHTAAYLMGNNGAETRSFGFSGRSRFHRNRGDNSSGASGSTTPLPPGADIQAMSEQLSDMRRAHREATGSGRRSRVDDLEEMMVMEAIRLSIATEEDRKKKSDKQAAKEARKKAKDEKKKEKKDRKGVYGSGNSSASASALSLGLPGMGRRRGNSGSSNLAREITQENAQPSSHKGKEVDRSMTSLAIVGSATLPMAIAGSGTRSFSGIPGARHLDSAALANIPDPSASPTVPDRPSHLRQMSNASSPSSSYIESIPGSLRNGFTHGSSSSLDTPNAPGTHYDGQDGGTPEGDDTSGNAGNESMFNFQSLAAMIGDDDDDKADAARHIEHLGGKPGETSEPSSHEESSTFGLEASQLTLKADDSKNSTESTQQVDENRQTTLLGPQTTTPEVKLTAVTPGVENHGDDSGKQLGAGWTETQYEREVTQ